MKFGTWRETVVWFAIVALLYFVIMNVYDIYHAAVERKRSQSFWEEMRVRDSLRLADTTIHYREVSVDTARLSARRAPARPRR